MNNETVIKSLKEIGLNEHEAALYIEILRNGEASVGKLLEKVPLHREQAYRALKSMKEDGLVTEYEKHKRMYFSATDPDLLIKQVKDKLKIAESVQPILQNMHQRSPHIVMVRKDIESFQVLFEDILQTLKQNKEYLILGGQGEGFEQLKSVWSLYEKYVKKYTKKNIKLRMIAFEGQDFTDQFQAQPLLEVKELPGEYIGPVATVIYGNKVALEVMDPDNISIVTIENKNIAESYHQQFDALWQIAKPVEGK